MYSRAQPSPRYQELLAAYRRMHEEGDPSIDATAEQTFAGASLRHHITDVRKLVAGLGARTLLDYGSGKGMIHRLAPLQLADGRRFENLAAYWGLERTACYDPAYASYAARPVGTFDLVICTDVLEHCPEEDLDWILEDIAGHARLGVYLVIACYVAKKSLPNGENAHVTVHPPAWWREKLKARLAVRAGLRWYAVFEELKDGISITQAKGVTPA